ncbi:microtubule-associated protein 9 isoform X3 [Cygnus atratus]|uniref:microtubule-associated protein 9 isoform X3 n=1 Tax=Cygnus atratus TaxID=8868 RepID=UPI0021B84622|nr:microtubule-associated protein 9 isoform X3 [Cygnus atratus]
MRAAGPAVREQPAVRGGRRQPAARGRRSQAGRRKAQGLQAAAMPGKGGGRRAGARRGAAQGELQEAISADAAREQTAVYSDDFESEEVAMLNGIVEECRKSNSDADSTKKSVAFESPLSDDGASQKAADLENEGADDLTLSFREKKLQQKTLSESENIQDDRINEVCCLESKNEDNARKNNEEYSAAELQCHMSEIDHCNDLPMPELKKERKAVMLDQKEKKPIPKPRVHKTRNTSASDERKDTSPSGLKLEDNINKTLSVIEAMTTTAYEKTKKSEKSTDDSSDKKENIVQGQIVTGTVQEASVDGQSEHVESKNTSEDFVKKQSETKATVLQKSKPSSCRSLSSAHLKKKAKAVPSATAVSPQYLGTLKVLENKHLQKNSREFGKADSLRAAVFQNWLEKKRALLLELKRNEKKKAENLRINTEKKEAVKRKEAIASFEAWKAMKAKEAKKLSEKKKLEELKKKKAEEQNAEKIEAAQKAFEKWKERKTEYLREQSRKEKQSERIRKKKEEELVEEKKKDNVSAVEKWNEKKEEYIKQKKAEKILERRKQEIQQTKKDEKDKKAIEEYERWLKKTERREQLERKQKKLQAACGDEVRSPWSPPGKVMYSRNY